MMIQRPDRVELHQFESGYSSTVDTLRLMAASVEREHTSPRIRARARQILRDYGPITSLDVDSEIAAVWAFVLDNIRYVRDPIGAEHITSAVELDKEIDDGSAMEDCESLALYAATLFAAIGIPSEFEIQGRRPDRPDRFSHCSLAVQNPRTKQWVSFDPVGAFEFPGEFGLGDTLHQAGEPLERWSLDGERTCTGDRAADTARQLLGEAFGDSAANLATAKTYGDPVAQGAGALGPYGALVGGLWQGGTALADMAIGKPAAGQSAPAQSPAGKGGAPPKIVAGQTYQPFANRRPAMARGSAAIALAPAGEARPSWLAPVAVVGGALLLGKLLLR